LAPLAGLERTPPPSLQSPGRRSAGLLWHDGKDFYNFLRLHAVTEKFDPVWQPRFQAASGTIGPFIARADVAAFADPLRGSIGR
jgi:phosphatidylglycerol lysyltransferase